MAGESGLLLEDVAELVRGVSYRPTDLTTEGASAVPLLRATNIGNRSLELADVLYVPSGLVRDAQLLRCFDVVIAMSSGSRQAVGRLAQLRKDWVGCVGAFCAVIRPDPKRVCPAYLGYVLQSPDFRERIETYAVGTAIMNLSRERLFGFPLRLPPLPEQQAIAHILGTLDDKIGLNRRMNETLEAMVRALFKSWFVDFDPVRAKAEGRPTGLPPHLADLFPDSFEDSELGEIPKGWRVGRFGDVAGHPRRGVQPSELAPSTPYIALEHMPRRCVALAEWGTAGGLESGKFGFRKGELLFGKLRPYFHKVGVAPVDGVCSTDIVVVAPKQEDWFGFVLGHLSSDAFVEHTNAGATGTRMPRTSWDEMSRYPVVVPPEPVAKAFTGWVRPAVGSMIAGIHGSRTLAALRDALLPKLISGELRVQDAEGVAERATA